jgi:hypothetical protein
MASCQAIIFRWAALFLFSQKQLGMFSGAAGPRQDGVRCAGLQRGAYICRQPRHFTYPDVASGAAALTLKIVNRRQAGRDPACTDCRIPCKTRCQLGDYMLDPRDFRLRYFSLIILAAILVAALLRHTLHVYGEMSREAIGADALLAAVAVGVAMFCVRRLFRRKPD